MIMSYIETSKIVLVVKNILMCVKKTKIYNILTEVCSNSF